MKTSLHSETDNGWRGFAASIPGSGHIRRGIPCQDASTVMISPRPAAIVCDGRGSASLSHFGAQSSIEAFRFQMAVLEPFLVNILDEEEEKRDQWIKFCQIIYRTFVQVKYDLAKTYAAEEKEFDCTVAFAIAGKKHIGCFQVGDGLIVVRQNGICKTVFLPEKGEFVNQTHFPFLGGEEKIEFQHTLLDAEINYGIAITSDGPEYLMFHLADMMPGKIFDTFLNDLYQGELCQQDLMDYLTRREWAEDPRGNDDRSLALLAYVKEGMSCRPISESRVSSVSSLPTEHMPEQISENNSDFHSECPREDAGEQNLVAKQDTFIDKETPEEKDCSIQGSTILDLIPTNNQCSNADGKKNDATPEEDDIDSGESGIHLEPSDAIESSLENSVETEKGSLGAEESSVTEGKEENSEVVS